MQVLLQCSKQGTVLFWLVGGWVGWQCLVLVSQGMGGPWALHLMCMLPLSGLWRWVMIPWYLFQTDGTSVILENIYIASSVDALQNWSPDNALLLSAANYPTWSITINVPALTAIQYKYIHKYLLLGSLIQIGWSQHLQMGRNQMIRGDSLWMSHSDRKAKVVFFSFFLGGHQEKSKCAWCHSVTLGFSVDLD